MLIQRLSKQSENVGTFDAGIKAAEWSPDDELLAIVTGARVLLSHGSATLVSPPAEQKMHIFR
jgi:hypothetical protein